MQNYCRIFQFIIFIVSINNASGQIIHSVSPSAISPHLPPRVAEPIQATDDHTLLGVVTNPNREPVAFGHVFIPELQKGTTTDSYGQFMMDHIPSGTFVVVVSGVGYTSLELTITVPCNKLSITLQKNELELEAVTIEVQSATSIQRGQPIQSVVIDTKTSSSQPSTLVEMINRSAGVRVRQTGGLGSSANLLLNGFQGRAIKYFKDGIPMDYLGSGYDFTLVPTNMLDRLEIYKGVLPVHLGADALGGGLNMVSKKIYGRHAEVSYEIASFNTHRFSLNTIYHPLQSHFFTGLDLYFNHSDNDYTVTAPVVNENGNVEDQKVSLFHNGFTQYFAEVYGGLTNTSWADELRVSLTAFKIDRENQFGSRMNDPFGASTNHQYAVIPSLRYRYSLLNDRLTVDQFLVANTIHSQKIDTLRGTYSWLQVFTPSNTRKGEETEQGSAANTSFSIFTSRTNIGLLFNDQQSITFNAVFTSNERVGKDSLGHILISSGRDILSIPARYKKLVLSTGLKSVFFNNRLTNELIVKYFRSNVQAIDADYFGNEIIGSSWLDRWGIAEAIKYRLNEHSFVRISAELATRMPEQDELFGDGNLHVSNVLLTPENSLNLNAGFRSSTPTFTMEANAFYRITKDLILTVPYNLIFQRSENLDNVKGLGTEIDASAHLQKWLMVNANMTYQDFRHFDTGNAMKEGARLKNTPFFFANLGVNLKLERLFATADRFQAYWYYSFVRQYYLNYLPKNREPDGFLSLWGDAKLEARNIIPDQNLHTAGITYYLQEDKVSIGFQVKNVFDAQVFDNFKIQNAGRSYHLKLTYSLQKSTNNKF